MPGSLEFGDSIPNCLGELGEIRERTGIAADGHPAAAPEAVGVERLRPQENVQREKGVGNRKMTFMHQCARNGFPTRYPPSVEPGLSMCASITLAPKKLIRTRRASEENASEPSLARRVSMCKDAKLSCRGNIHWSSRRCREAVHCFPCLQGCLPQLRACAMIKGRPRFHRLITRRIVRP